MSRLLRMTYGHGGSRLKRVQVCGGQGELRPEPLWLRLMLGLMLLAVPLLVCRYAVPPVAHRDTLIDVGRLTLQTFEPVPATPPKPPPAPQPKALEAPREQPPLPIPQVPRERILPPSAEEVRPPAISRPAGPALPREQEPPRITRQRLQADMQPAETAAPPVRRAEAPGKDAPPPVGITRARQAVTAETGSGELPVAVRRSPVAQTLPPESPAPRSLGRNRPQSADAGLTETAGRVSPTRQRTEPARAAERGTAAQTQVARGVSLTNLDICPGNRQEEDMIKEVLSVVGSRSSCANDKGTFHFIGTQRISSFNLIIYPGVGRKPSNRCEELENAYRCLKAR